MFERVRKVIDSCAPLEVKMRRILKMSLATPFNRLLVTVARVKEDTTKKMITKDLDSVPSMGELFFETHGSISGSLWLVVINI